MSVANTVQFMTPLLAYFLLTIFLTTVNAGTEKEAQKYLESLEEKYSQMCNLMTESNWESGININEATNKKLEQESEKFSDFTTKVQIEVLEKFPNWREFKNKTLQRAFKYMSIWGPASMPAEIMHRSGAMRGEFKTAYSTATVCRYNHPTDCNMHLDEIEAIMKNSRDAKELAYYFTAWHDKMGSLVTPEKYANFVDLINEFARANGYKYESELTLLPYDDESGTWTFENFQKTVLGLSEELYGLYAVLHAYVRMKLRRFPQYRGLIEKCGYIPAHLTGNMWAQDWSALDKITKPFPNAQNLDATEAMVKKGYTPLKMFQESDKFFKDLGLMGVSQTFWNKSVLEKPKDGRDMICHASAFDMCKGKGSTDFRIRQCTNINQYDFYTTHHEMGHIEYFQQFTNLPFIFRGPANPGFGEAIGDALALAVVTPTHLQCKLGLDLGFDKSFCQSKRGPYKVTETDINYLYLIALDKLAFLPFASAVDFYRFEILEGQIQPYEYNNVWWNIRKAFTGIVPPTNRALNSKYFDPAAKFHVAANIDYIRYFVSHVIQFQFYEALCIAAGEFTPFDRNSKPLYQCDFSGSKAAGRKLANMMKLGFSKGWVDALEMVTGSRNMSILPLQNFLQPLLDHMAKELRENGELRGFGESCEEVEKRGGRKSGWIDLVPENKRPVVVY